MTVNRWLLGAAALLVSVALAGCGGDDTGSDDSAARDRRASGSGGADEGSGAPAEAAQAEPRKIIVDSSIELEVPQLRSAYLEIGGLARAAGGYVANSSIDDSGQDDASATLRIRVPAARHDELLIQLRGLGGGRVLGERTSAREVTEEYTDLTSRLQNLSLTEAQYQELLKKAVTVDDILNVQARLDGVRAQAEQTRGRLNLLDSLVDFATINVTLTVPGTPASEGIPGPAEVFSDSWDASIVVARVVLNVAVVLSVVAIWLAVPALLVLLGAWWWSRWRKKHPKSGGQPVE